MPRRRVFKGKEYRAVYVEKPLCDGCIFERSAIGKECINVRHPACTKFEREDGLDVIFQFV